MESSEKIADIASCLRLLPSVDELVQGLQRSGANGVSDQALAGAARRAIAARRQKLLEGELPSQAKDKASLQEALLDDAREILVADKRLSMRKVVNATGIVLHTNLGRAPLGEGACRALLEVAKGYSNLEYDLDTGRRGKRGSGIEELLQRLTGAEAALVVNNNAAAVMFAIRTIAEGREVVVSRGELIEIGGSFRIPDIMLQSGARLVEVGTTNKTRITDYRSAVTPDTGLLLKAHTSNFRILGFTEEVSREDLAALGREVNLPVMEDLGSGCFLNAPGVPHEPTVSESVAAGIDVVTFSGDKLLGGPQAGIVVGKSEWISKMKTHPLMRILRLDKLTLAALEATLRAYLDAEAAHRDIPVLRMLGEGAGAILKRAQGLLDELGPAACGALGAEVVETEGQVGGGAIPLAELKSGAIALAPGGYSATQLEIRLRRSAPPIVARIHEDRVLLDLRCVDEEDLEILARILRELADEISA